LYQFYDIIILDIFNHKINLTLLGERIVTTVSHFFVFIFFQNLFYSQIKYYSDCRDVENGKQYTLPRCKHLFN